MKTKTERFFWKPKKADNDNDSGTDNEIENENDIDSGTDSGTDNERLLRKKSSVWPLRDRLRHVSDAKRVFYFVFILTGYDG